MRKEKPERRCIAFHSPGVLPDGLQFQNDIIVNVTRSAIQKEGSPVYVDRFRSLSTDMGRHCIDEVPSKLLESGTAYRCRRGVGGGDWSVLGDNLLS